MHYKFKLISMFLLNVIFFIPACVQKEPVRLTVISTNDFHGQIESGTHSDLGGRDLGGFDWLLGYFKAVREENPQGIILLDGGDLWQGTMLSNVTRGQAVIDLYNAAGYDAVAIGNHEFDFGPGESGGQDLRFVLKNRLKEAHFPMLGANVVKIEDHKPLIMDNFKPYTIIERKGVKVGIIGLATPSTKYTTAPKHIYDLEFTDVVSAALKYSQKVREEGAQVVILLTHMGASWDAAGGRWQGEAVDLVRQVGDEVDLVIGGHTHTVISQKINGVPVMSAGFYGRSFTRADIVLDGKGTRPKVELWGPTFFFHKTTSEALPTYHGRVIEPDHSFDQKFLAYAEKVKAVENQPYGLAVKKITREGRYDSAVGHLVCDALLASVSGAQVALANQGSLRADLPAGQLTFGHIYRVMPFDNEAVKVTLSGEQLVRALEQGFAGEHGTLEISGIKVFVRDNKVTKVIFSDGSVLEKDKQYTVVTNDFLYARGDGFSALSEGPMEKTNLKIRDILAAYVKENSPLQVDPASRYFVERP